MAFEKPTRSLPLSLLKVYQYSIYSMVNDTAFCNQHIIDLPLENHASWLVHILVLP